VLELCTGGNLQDSFRQHRDGFDMVSASSTCVNSTATQHIGWGPMTACVNWQSVGERCCCFADQVATGAAAVPLIDRLTTSGVRHCLLVATKYLAVNRHCRTLDITDIIHPLPLPLLVLPPCLMLPGPPAVSAG
jgi:hypothetical protein